MRIGDIFAGGRIGVLEARQRADEDRYVAIKLYVERLEKRIEYLNHARDDIESLHKRLTEVERFANSINTVVSGQVDDLADRIAKLEDRLSSLEGVHVNASIKHAERLDALETQQCSIIKALGMLTTALRGIPRQLNYSVSIDDSRVYTEADGG